MNKINFPIKRLLMLVGLLFLFFSCVREEEMDNTPQGNFDALWTIIDERYCFLDYKEIDWNQVYAKHKKRITPSMPSEGLFEVLGDMLAELKDGHVNLYSASDVSRYWKWHEEYPTNFREDIQSKYLGTDYKIASGLKYKVLNDNIGYVYYESFSSGIGEGNLDQVLSKLALCDGLILDVRSNGGGNASNSSKLAARFTNKRVLTGYIQHKTGTGHNEFSKPLPIYLEPSNGVRWQKKVVVLTNRHSYSATNDFVNIMKILPLVTIMGDQTGGGSGMPISSELPNGWMVRFSSSPHLNSKMEHIEFGIEPDVNVQMTSADQLRDLDTIIESARSFLKEN